MESVRDFNLLLRRAIWRDQRAEDRAGLIALHVLLAAGVTFKPSTEPPPEGTPTFERVMGREAVPFFDPVPQSDAEIEAEAERKRQQAATLALAQRQLYETQMRMKYPDRIEGDAPPEPEPSPVE